MSRTEIVIERLVLDGLEFGPGGETALRAAVEAHLIGVFAGGAGGERAQGGHDSDVRASASSVAEPSATGLGREAALAIHRSVYR